MKKLMLAVAVCAMTFGLFAKDDIMFPVIPRNAANIVSYDATKFGFAENLRTNQVVQNVKLVDQVLAMRNGRAQIIKAGDFQYVVTGFVEDKKLGIKGFGAVCVTADSAALATALQAYETSGTIPTVKPGTENFVFIAYKGKTFTLFKGAE